MDAVAEARSGFETALDAWAKDGKTLIQTGKALGVDTSRVIATLSGGMPSSGGGAAGRTTPRRRTTAARRARSGGGNGTGGAPSGEQILEAITALPMNQAQLARRFHTTRQTVAKRLRELQTAGKATLVNGAWTASPSGDTGGS